MTKPLDIDQAITKVSRRARLITGLGLAALLTGIGMWSVAVALAIGGLAALGIGYLCTAFANDASKVALAQRHETARQVLTAAYAAKQETETE